MIQLRQFQSDSSGSVLISFALVLVPVALILGAVLDIGTVFNAKNGLQQKLDSIALTAAHGFIANSGKSDSDIHAAIGNILDGHLKVLSDNVGKGQKFRYSYKVNTKKKTVSIRGRVVVKSEVLQIAGHDKFKAKLESIAKANVESQPVCILALGRNSNVGIQFVGEGKVKAKDCVIWSDADGAQSIKFNGRGKVESESLCAVGRAGILGQFKADPLPQSYCQPVPDPLRNWMSPYVGACTHTNTDWIRRTTAILNPGVYCGGLRVDAKNINMKPGIYVIKDGPLILRGSSKIKGEGIGIFLTGDNAYLDIDGKSKVDITAAVTGAMAGVSIAADATTVMSGKSIINGRSDLKIGGVVYLPNQHLAYWGESDTWAASPVTTIIADSIEIGGKAYLEVKNDSKKAKYAPVMQTSKGTVLLIN